MHRQLDQSEAQPEAISRKRFWLEEAERKIRKKLQIDSPVAITILTIRLKAMEEEWEAVKREIRELEEQKTD